MKLKGLLIVIILFKLQVLLAQDDRYRFDGSILQDYKFLNSPSVQSPDVTAFQKVSQIPVSNYTGRANISIPIYQIQVGRMSVPISIVYNSSGVKVADMPSNVGSNWSLNAGGVVTKTVRGIDDFTYPEIIHTRVSHDSKTPSGWLGKVVGFEPDANQENDPLPDIYNVSAPGLSTKFTHERVSYTNKAIPLEIEKKGNLIEDEFGLLYTGYFGITDPPLAYPRHGFTTLNIKSLNGIQYSFLTPEVSCTYKSGVTLGMLDKAVDFKINAFKLDSMFDPATNQTINFVYEEYSNTFFDKFHPQPYSFNYSYNAKTNRLKQINFENGSVEFIYGLQREDNTGEKALTEILVKNHLGTVIKNVKFEYSYFQSTINPTSPQSKRLRLDRVYQVDSNNLALVGEYTLTYNTNVDMPPRDSWAHDFLGYNNGVYSSSNTTPTPKIYKNELAYDSNYKNDDTSTSSHRVYIPFDNGTAPVRDERSGLVGNFSLEADEEASKAYILKSIEYPTGGKSEFEYEINEFGGSRIGGGLRIKTIKNIDEFGVEQISDYNYSSGYMIQMPRYVTYGAYFKIYNVPQANVELTSGSFVGYSSVGITNRYDKESTWYSYFTKKDYPNIYSAKTIFGSSYRVNESRAWRANANYSLYLDRDMLRGKLKKKVITDKNGLYRLKQQYEYTLKNFRNINYTFQNPTYQSDPRGCYTESGLYVRDCGGYDEEIDYPVDRNLLTKVTTQVLGDFHNEHGGNQVISDYVQTEKTYTYDDKYPRVVSEQQSKSDIEYEKLIDECNGNVACENDIRQTYPLVLGAEYMEKTYEYPMEGSLLWGQHRLDSPVSVTLSNERVHLKSNEIIYKDFGQGIIDIEQSNYFGSNRFNPQDPIESTKITKRDHKGNILEVLTQDGIYTSFIYGYGSRYLICELKNVSYNELISATLNLNITLEDLINSTSDSEIKTKTNQIRNQIDKGRITSYTHKPLVGITSVIDVRGRETTYEYDGFNRLIYLKDHDKNIISQNSYIYKN